MGNGMSPRARDTVEGELDWDGGGKFESRKRPKRGAYKLEARAIFFNRNEGNPPRVSRDATLYGYRPAVSRIENGQRARWRAAND